MGEAYMNHAGKGRWRAYSAGSTPTGKVNPYAIETLAAHGFEPRQDARSKSWDTFAEPDAPVMNAVVTVCDNAAGEVCPIWPSHDGEPPRRMHWSFPDPAATQGTDDEKRAAFEAVFKEIRARIDNFLENE